MSPESVEPTNEEKPETPDCCTCGAPLGAEHNPGCPQLKIWTPPEKLDPNVQRMAWLMFIEGWKNFLLQRPNDAGLSDADTKEMYGCCLVAAKIVRQCEHEAGGQ